MHTLTILPSGSAQFESNTVARTALCGVTEGVPAGRRVVRLTRGQLQASFCMCFDPLTLTVLAIIFADPRRRKKTQNVQKPATSKQKQ
jgi:hypothetical protein